MEANRVLFPRVEPKTCVEPGIFSYGSVAPVCESNFHCFLFPLGSFVWHTRAALTTHQIGGRPPSPCVQTLDMDSFRCIITAGRLSFARAPRFPQLDINKQRLFFCIKKTTNIHPKVAHVLS